MVDELRELNERVAREVMQVKPRVTWEILNADESASIIGFDFEGDAHHWLREHPALRDRHVGAWEHWPFYSTDIAAAMEVIAKFSDTPHENKISNHIGLATISIHQYPDNSWLVNFVGKGKAQDATLPLAICRAALATISKEGDGDSESQS